MRLEVKKGIKRRCEPLETKREKKKTVVGAFPITLRPGAPSAPALGVMESEVTPIPLFCSAVPWPVTSM
jgi:hypothetical protein